MKIHPDFLDFFRALNANRVEYVIVGSYALAFHGAPRATGDIDIWIRPVEANAEALLAALREFGFGSLEISVQDVLSGKIIQMGFPPVRIDLVTLLDGLDADQIWASKERGRFGEENVFYLGRDAFIRNKRAAGRHKDLADLELLGETVD
jgi:hypothetical protein